MAAADVDSALDGLLESLTQAAGHALDDDLALLLACYDPLSCGGAADAVEVAEELAADPANVGRARRLLRAALAESGNDIPVDAAVLLLSEVVTNAFVHAGGVVTVRVRATPAGVRVEVEDRSLPPPHPSQLRCHRRDRPRVCSCWTSSPTGGARRPGPAARWCGSSWVRTRARGRRARTSGPDRRAGRPPPWR